MTDPGGIIPRSIITSFGLNMVLERIAVHAEHFGEKEGSGVAVLRSLIKKRIGAASGMRLLGVIAVMAEAAKTPANVARVLRLDASIVAAEISGLVRDGLLEETNGRLHYKHKYINDEATNMLSAADRIKAHEDAAAVLLEDLRQDGDKSSPELLTSIAYHYAEAERYEEAREYSMLAANNALRLGDVKGAKVLFSRLLEHLDALGPSKKAASKEFYSLSHERLHCLVHVGRLEEAEATARMSHDRSLLRSVVPRVVRLKAALSRLKVISVVRPTFKVMSVAEVSFYELKQLMWAEIAERTKVKIGIHGLLELTLEQLDCGIRSGDSDCFTVSILAVARYFISRGDAKQANR